VAFLVLKFLLLLFDFHGAQQEGEVLLVYMCRRHVTGLIHGAAAGADASCIYLESFSFSLLCIIGYTHTVLSNFHIVTTVVTIWKLGRTVCVYSTRYGGGFAALWRHPD
jgi:hypothetical protein